jgi:hypothetical protein
MHRATPLNTSFRSYSSGGARTMIHAADDSKMMQEMGGNFMKNETRDKVESPQNYGFSSVVRNPTQDALGNIISAAEGFINFIGGNRSFPVCGIMDDRRHRPMGMKEGENAQYDDLGQMTILRRTGLFLLSLDSPDDSQKQQQKPSSPQVNPLDGSGSSSSSQQQNVERFVSLRHVEKPKQDRSPGGASKRGDYKHEGQSVNLETRVSKKRIEFRDGDTNVVGYYDKNATTWYIHGASTVHIEGGTVLIKAGTTVIEGIVKLGASTDSGADVDKPVGILGSVDTHGDELISGLAGSTFAK